MRCHIHHKYRASKKPTASCLTCWGIYEIELMEKLDKAQSHMASLINKKFQESGDGPRHRVLVEACGTVEDVRDVVV